MKSSFSCDGRMNSDIVRSSGVVWIVMSGSSSVCRSRSSSVGGSMIEVVE